MHDVKRPKLVDVWMQEHMLNVAVWKHGPKSKIRLGDRKACLHSSLHWQRPEASEALGAGSLLR